jgi:hypothetical protein
MTSPAVAMSRNARKREASKDLFDAERFHNPSFRDGGPDCVKLEEEPVDMSFAPPYCEHGSPD